MNSPASMRKPPRSAASHNLLKPCPSPAQWNGSPSRRNRAEPLPPSEAGATGRRQSSQVTGGPMVRIHLPPAESQQTFGTASSLELQNRVQHQEATNPPIVAKTHSGGLPASPRSRRFGLVGNEQ